MNRTTILSPTVASLAIIRDNPSAPPGAAIRHVAVFVANITSCGKHQFRIAEQTFGGSEDGRDVTDWLASVIAPGTDIALRPASSMRDPSPATDLEGPSPWWPIADMAWLRQRFGEEPRIYTLNLSNSDIRETAEGSRGHKACAKEGYQGSLTRHGQVFLTFSPLPITAISKRGALTGRSSQRPALPPARPASPPAPA